MFDGFLHFLDRVEGIQLISSFFIKNQDTLATYIKINIITVNQLEETVIIIRHASVRVELEWT